MPTATLVALQTLPRLIWQTSLLDDPAEPATLRPDEVESRLARALGRIESTAGAQAGRRAGSTPAETAGEARAPDAALLQAVASAGSSSDRYFRLLRDRSDPADRQQARQAALQSQMRLFDLAQGRASTLLDSRGRAVAQGRALLFGSLTLLALLALALAVRLWRGLLQWQDAAQALNLARPLGSTAEGPAGDAAARRAQSDQLMERLRGAERPPTNAADAADGAVRTVPADPDR
jgi:hypothetical protein